MSNYKSTRHAIGKDFPTPKHEDRFRSWQYTESYPVSGVGFVVIWQEHVHHDTQRCECGKDFPWAHLGLKLVCECGKVYEGVAPEGARSVRWERVGPSECKSILDVCQNASELIHDEAMVVHKLSRLVCRYHTAIHQCASVLGETVYELRNTRDRLEASESLVGTMFTPEAIHKWMKEASEEDLATALGNIGSSGMDTPLAQQANAWMRVWDTIGSIAPDIKSADAAVDVALAFINDQQKRIDDANGLREYEAVKMANDAIRAQNEQGEASEIEDCLDAAGVKKVRVCTLVDRVQLLVDQRDEWKKQCNMASKVQADTVNEANGQLEEQDARIVELEKEVEQEKARVVALSDIRKKELEAVRSEYDTYIEELEGERHRIESARMGALEEIRECHRRIGDEGCESSPLLRDNVSYVLDKLKASRILVNEASAKVKESEDLMIDRVYEAFEVCASKAYEYGKNMRDGEHVRPHKLREFILAWRNSPDSIKQLVRAGRMARLKAEHEAYRLGHESGFDTGRLTGLLEAAERVKGLFVVEPSTVNEGCVSFSIGSVWLGNEWASQVADIVRVSIINAVKGKES